MTPDPTRQEVFAGLMVDVLNNGALALLTSVGHQTGLFDMSTLTPSTGENLAKAAHLDERYVREWLGGMVGGGILKYDPHGATYTLTTSLNTGGAGLGTVWGEQTARRMPAMPASPM